MLCIDFWTTLRHELLGNENFGLVGMSHGLDACIISNGGTVRVTAGMVATALEAILGAVERDGGYDAFVGVMAHLGLTRHALLSSVTFLPRHLFITIRSAANHSLDLLGPVRGCPRITSCMGTAMSIRNRLYQPG